VTHKEEAEALFSGGFNCAQSILTAFGVDLGIERDIALKLASPFGGGIGRTGHVCGAVTGAIMVIGLKFGAANTWNKVQKARVIKRTQQFIERFKRRHNNIECRELIGVDIGTDAGRTTYKRGNFFETHCTNFVRDAAEILDEIV
jgi:C_GCAxxG_C_C family probable redox protein